MADLNLTKSRLEDLNVSEDECDEESQSLPESLFMTEYLKDPYESDNSVEPQQKDRIGMINRACSACYSTAGENKKFMAKTQLSLEECLQELLEFSLQGSQRSNCVDGLKTFDGHTVKEIISRWHDIILELAWLWEHFSVNTDISNTTVDKLTLVKIEHFKKITNYQPDYFSMSITEGRKQYKVAKRCTQFVNKFLDMIAGFGCPSTSPVAAGPHDKDIPMLSLVAQLLDIKHRQGRHNKLNINISDLCPVVLASDQESIVGFPDFVFLSDLEHIAIPVEVSMPEHDKLDSTSGGDEAVHKPNDSSEQDTHTTFSAQYLLQHIGFLIQRILKSRNWKEKIDETKYLNGPLESVGLFLVNNRLFFNKVQTTPGHLSSLTKELWTDYYIEHQGVATFVMKDRHVKDGIKIRKSNWSLDLNNGVHRNALLVFLVHYINGSDHVT